jgi:hypothetical protein
MSWSKSRVWSDERRPACPGAERSAGGFAPSLQAGVDARAGARVARPRVDLADRRHLRRRQAVRCVRARAQQRARIEPAGRRVVDNGGHDPRAGSNRGPVDHRQLAQRDEARRVVEGRARLPHPGGRLVRPVVRRGAGDDAVVVVGETLGLHERFMATVGAAGKVREPRRCAVEGRDDQLGGHRGDVVRPVAPVGDLLRMPEREARTGRHGRVVTHVGAGGGVTTQEPVQHEAGRRAQVPSVTAVAAMVELPVPAAHRHPHLEVDLGVASRPGRPRRTAERGHVGGRRGARADERSCRN